VVRRPIADSPAHLVRLPRLRLGAVTLIAVWALGASPALEAEASPPPPVDASAAPSTPVDPALPLDEAIDALLADAEFLRGSKDGPVRVGISVVDLETGASLYEHEAQTALNPASNAKLITTAAALRVLGPEHRYATRIWAEGSTRDGAIGGKLYLQGGGDPSLVTGEVYELAGQLEAAGITTVRGPIVVDATRFDADGLPPGFDQKQEFASHRAPGGAMSVNYNTYEVHARPAEQAGGPPQLRVLPKVPSIVIENEARTVVGKRNKLWVSSVEQKGRTVLTFHGEIGVDAAGGSYRYPIADPSRYAGELLLISLRQRGIKVKKSRIQSGEVPSGAKLIATTRSETLSQLCRSVNKWSNNFMAEQILRTLAPGDGATAEAALEVVRQFTRDIGMPQAGLVIGNGSGLYDNNMVSPAALTHLLRVVYDDFRISSDYLASLSIMGHDGTARSRLHDSEASGWLRVKTGTLDGVSALSGYAGSEDRDPIVFSILMNNLERKHRAKARALQNDIAELVAREAAQTR